MKITDVEVVIVRQDEVKMIGDGSQDTADILEYCAQETVLSKNLVRHHFQLDKEGFVHIPDAPGIGVELNWDILNKYRR